MPDHTAFTTTARTSFHANLSKLGLLAWNPKKKKEVSLVLPSIADGDNRDSIAIAGRLFATLQISEQRPPLSAQKAGSDFEAACVEFLDSVFRRLEHIRPGPWEMKTLSARRPLEIAQFEQYAHLRAVADACEANEQLAASLGRDYLIAPDIVLVRQPLKDSEINASDVIVDGASANRSSLRAANKALPFLHASVSCKLTMRSDRAQNSRAEALNLIRNRKGRVPHIAVVTAEPLPSRLGSLALGTGDLDCVYHIALPELIAAVEAGKNDDSTEALRIMVDGKRLKDISDLPLDLAL